MQLGCLMYFRGSIAFSKIKCRMVTKTLKNILDLHLLVHEQQNGTSRRYEDCSVLYACFTGVWQNELHEELPGEEPGG